MKQITLPVLALCLCFCFTDSQAQSVRSLIKNRLSKEKVEIKSEEDSMTVFVVDDVTDPSSRRITDEALMEAFGLTDNVPYEEQYQFDAYIQVQLSDYKKNGKLDDQVVYHNYMKKEKADYAMISRDENTESTILFDVQNHAMLILTDSDGEKSGFATTIDPEAIAAKAEAYAEESDEDPMQAHKTGRKKQILGYTCEEYLVEDEASETHIWASEELGKKMRKEWMSNQQAFGGSFTYANTIQGMILEYELKNKEDGDRVLMEVTQLDLNHRHSISTQDYTIMSMRMKTDEEKAED